ncbi:MAG TPA: outer membrane lipoprotein-sorting protein, partial [Cytophagales bacterium]|nr:outer membrane lipoprotein-sorting protein [Cytophagales bacterium]
SDYKEVAGLYFPYSMTQGIKGGPSQPIIIEKIEVNPAVSDADFKFPSN